VRKDLQLNKLRSSGRAVAGIEARGGGAAADVMVRRRMHRGGTGRGVEEEHACGDRMEEGCTWRMSRCRCWGKEDDASGQHRSGHGGQACEQWLEEGHEQRMSGHRRRGAEEDGCRPGHGGGGTGVGQGDWEATGVAALPMLAQSGGGPVAITRLELIIDEHQNFFTF
jgi:hypothetical protein